MHNTPVYKPISCSFYEYLEEAATLGQIAAIEYLMDNSVVKVKSKIKTLTIQDKVEFMILENNESIRLDKLVSFNRKLLPKTC